MLSSFPILILIGRPASGKSEIIDYLQHTTSDERLQRFHLAKLDILDDFPMLWTWFEEDHILSQQLKKPRLHTNDQGYFIYIYLWDLLIERINLEYSKRLRNDSTYHQHTTTIIEFSRGNEHGGYQAAFQHISKEILSQARILYVNVPFEESLRKNRSRFNPDRPDSILEHSLPDEKLIRLYREDDWGDLTKPDPKFLKIRNLVVPYAVFENADDVTTGKSQLLGKRLEETISKLT